MTILPCPILVVSYNDDTRSALTTALINNNVDAISCANFCEAENLALQGLYNGLVVDLPTIIKSKGEEKIVAYTLANCFPTLRVRAIGSVLIPMSMPGSAKQDKSLNDFLTKTCTLFYPRKLRAFRRHQVCLSTILKYQGEEFRSFTQDLSWGGAFAVDVFTEKFSTDTEVIMSIPELGFDLSATINWIKPWGLRQTPGIGVSFKNLDKSVETAFSDIFRSRREFDRDRLTT
ncbi:MAG: hypothetical protein A2X79_05610 [Desulfuromonadaceae bacterium GWB2_53_15]|nr:MAG: hypothetical protein A2X79_05610 [Desulfuromonadaceae bacterium GWB2_53_15]